MNRKLGQVSLYFYVQNEKPIVKYPHTLTYTYNKRLDSHEYSYKFKFKYNFLHEKK